MELKILIETPAGFAGANNMQFKIIKKLLFMKAKIKKEYINKAKTQLVYIIEVHTRHYLAVVRNVQMFRNFNKMLFKNRLAREGFNKLAKNKEDVAAVEKMLTKGTKISIIKYEEAAELKNRLGTVFNEHEIK